ncbi:MAG: 2OG-Fe(II) oxygenase [Cyclobacteriaceae bacterium]|nr:2OG-Fe(II) oxygenase [Cyclobacteriaceae bacterium]
MSALNQRVFEQIADGLADRGYSVVDGFLTSTEVDQILQSDEFEKNKLHFRKAAVGKTDKQINEGIRGDYIQWIDPATASPGESAYLHRLRELIAYLNQNLFLSLKGIDLHRTVYPIGAKYQRHLDQFHHDDHRKLSVICYLNKAWKEQEGGQLRLYHTSGPLDVLPEAGTLVCFRSDQLEHEVLPAKRERYSLTGWITDRSY